ncbi:MAG: hypothetical protein U9N61_09670 [Euryarchaeota archaeon]|nr:hypothetical protein [Euryarchaeota archaeon]
MKEYLLGNVAIARGILEAGMGVVTGYLGTPASHVWTLRIRKRREI